MSDAAEYTEILPGGAKLRQSRSHLRIGTDSVLLAENAAPGRRICDLGCGCGAVLIRLAELRPEAELCGLEIQPDAARLCRESIELNGMAGRVSAIIGDLRERDTLARLGAGSFDLVVCNPPYNRAGSGRRAASDVAALEREDSSAPPEAVARAAAYLLKNRGAADFVLRSDRLAEYICALCGAGLEPKRLLTVRTGGKLSRIVLLRAVRGAAPGLTLGECEYPENAARAPAE